MRRCLRLRRRMIRRSSSEARDDAHARGIQVNTVDEPERCDFITPGIIRRGDLIGGSYPGKVRHSRRG